MTILWKAVPVFLGIVWTATVTADTAAARCDIYPMGSDRTDTSVACTFSQRQGYITIVREDGIVHEWFPSGENVGKFLDQQGRVVFRQSGLGDQGLIFRTPDESVYVYWDTAALPSQDITENTAQPFTTEDYDAITLLRCRVAGDTEFGQCPAGILRMEDRQASIVVLSPTGEQFTINFMSDYINATNRELQARLVGDTWRLNFSNGEVWEVPLAAIEGG